ncbi:MAG: glutamate--cysteine ligase [Roseiarcus sp.]|jgi:glutamate--cysteine ligase
MARDINDAHAVESRDALVSWLEAGCKPAAQFRVGTEHEKIPFYRADLTPVPYDGARGVRALIEGLRGRLGWETILDGDNPIGLFDAAGGGAISLEPGGQFELSGAPLETVHETRAEVDEHLRVTGEVAAPLGIGFLALGMSPKWSLAETPAMPKSRYRIMARYMPKVGTRGLDMMFRTATVQANLDFSDEADMVKKLQVGLALQPLITALFANSPFTDGRLNGFLSARSEIWRHTDDARAGMLPFAFEPGMGFERYVDYALDVPMYFVKRGSVYHDVAGSSFRDLLAGRLEALPGERATIADWANHLSTIFPEVRLKRYLEMRGADVGPAARICALPALLVGLYYDGRALDAAWEIVRRWTAGERQKLRDEAPRLALGATVAGRSLAEIGREILVVARGGLARRGRRDAGGRDEGVHLDPLDAFVGSGRVAAQDWIARFEREWGGSVDPAFAEACY